MAGLCTLSEPAAPASALLAGQVPDRVRDWPLIQRRPLRRALLTRFLAHQLVFLSFHCPKSSVGCSRGRFERQVAWLVSLPQTATRLAQ